MHSVNQSNVLVEQLRTSWSLWLLKRSSTSPIIFGILKVIGMAALSPSTLGEIMEAALDAYFKQTGIIFKIYKIYFIFTLFLLLLML